MEETGKKKKAPGKKPPKEKPQRDEAGKFLPGNQAAAKWTEESAIAIGKKLIAWMLESQQNFWIEDFLFENDLYPDVLQYLCDRYQPFFDYIARAKAIQASRIQKFSLMNQLNSGMAQWVLSVHHKMQNVQKTETEVNNSQPIVIHIDAEDAKG